jgi:hypothetical protein
MGWPDFRSARNSGELLINSRMKWICNKKLLEERINKMKQIGKVDEEGRQMEKT